MRSLVFFSLLFLLVVSIFAQSPIGAKTTADEDVACIVGHSMTSNDAMEFLETLTDTINGRITGSAGSREAAELILKTLKQAGFENAHTEEYKLPSTWQHGSTTGEIVSPVPRALVIGSYGWVPGTNGPVEVAVSDLGPAVLDAPAGAWGRFQGAGGIGGLRSHAPSNSYVGVPSLLARQPPPAPAPA